MSLKYVIIDWSNGLWPVWHQAIIWTNADLLSVGPQEKNFGENRINEIAFENIVCPMAAIFVVCDMYDTSYVFILRTM